MVAGTLYGWPSAIFFTVPRRILPERVFGRRGTTVAVLKAATGPIDSRTRLNQLRDDRVGSPGDARLRHDETDRASRP